MWNKSVKNTRNCQQLSVLAGFLGTWLFIAHPAVALTAGDVLNKMEPVRRTGYIAGIIEGLAMARWMKDKPDQTGMQCIYDWYYSGDTEKNFNRITQWFERHPDKPSGGLLYVLIKKDCGD